MYDNALKNPKNIRQLFEKLEEIRIPAYQRAYSWEQKNCEQFFEDLMEQNGKSYYLGQLLFEKDGSKFFIIDGQQRLTTTLLFLSALNKVKSARGEETASIKDTYLTDVFRTIEDDQVIFKKVTQKHLISKIDNTETLSQKRIVDAFVLFETKLDDLDNDRLSQLQHSLETAVINTFYISSKVEATQVFEYQNNRGKSLSTFEIIKAYLMHQLYIHSPDNAQANNAVKDIQNNISKVYRYIECVEGYFSESELLNNYCLLFYGIQGTTEDVKKQLEKQSDRVNWIQLFFENFVELTHSAKSIVTNKDDSTLANLFLLGNAANWKIIALALYYKGENSGDKYRNILKLLEILCFKLKLGDYRTDRLPTFARNYFNRLKDYNFNSLYIEIKQATEVGFNWYWNDNDKFRNIINNYFDSDKMHYSGNRIKFVLWQYENHLRSQSRSGLLMDKVLFDQYTIEHINPQNPKHKEHSELFKKDYLHLSGNLALLTRSQNSQFTNKSFEDKRDLFQNTALISYTEIRNNSQWEENEILNRHEKISNFAKVYFDTSKI